MFCNGMTVSECLCACMCVSVSLKIINNIASVIDSVHITVVKKARTIFTMVFILCVAFHPNRIIINVQYCRLFLMCFSIHDPSTVH